MKDNKSVMHIREAVSESGQKYEDQKIDGTGF